VRVFTGRLGVVTAITAASTAGRSSTHYYY